MNESPLFVGMTSHTVHLLTEHGADARFIESIQPDEVKGRSVILAPSAAKPGAHEHAARKLRAMGAAKVAVITEDMLRPSGASDVADLIETSLANGRRPNIEMVEALALEKARTGDLRRDHPRIVALEIGELLQREFPPKEALLSPWLRRQDLVMIHAWRGVGKTHFAMNVAYAVAGGGSCLCWKAEKPRRVLYIDGEMPGAWIKERAAALVATTDENAEPPEGYFRIVTPDAQEAPIPDLATPEGQTAITEAIGDAELIVIDNLSCLVRSGVENEGESWLPVATWALRMRREGRCVIFVQHEGKNGLQRGTSRREDMLDVVLRLQQPSDYKGEEGARFEIRFKKARGLYGEAVKEIEAALVRDAGGSARWAWREVAGATVDRVIELQADGMSAPEIAAELGVNRSTVYRAMKKAKAEGRSTTGGADGKA